MQLQLVFCDSDQFVAKVIKTVTWSDFCHVGILRNGEVIDSRYKAGGVSISTLDELSKHYTRVVVRSYDVPGELVWEKALTQKGKPYDLTAVCGLPFRRNWQEDDKWFCSELVAWACKEAGFPLVHKETWRITPQDLWEVECGIIVPKQPQLILPS